MTLFFRSISLLAFLSSAFFGYLLLSKEEVKIGYVYNSRVLNEYQGVKDSRMAYRAQMQQWQNNLDTLSTQVQRETKRFESNKASMSEKERALSRQLIERKQADLLGYKQALESKAAEKDAELTKGVLNQIDAFLLEYGKENGYDYIFGVTDNGNILYAQEAEDITDEVLEALNTNYEGK